MDRLNILRYNYRQIGRHTQTFADRINDRKKERLHSTSGIDIHRCNFRQIGRHTQVYLIGNI